jgi:hypothetical protein
LDGEASEGSQQNLGAFGVALEERREDLFGTISKNYIGGREQMRDIEICWVFEEKDQEVGFRLGG